VNRGAISPRLWIAAGGTGGHVYPALALGEAVRRRAPDIEIAYSCGRRPGELAIYRSRGLEPCVLPLSGRRRGWVGGVRFAGEISRAFLQARGAMSQARPALAVGFGGYAAFPPLWAARTLGIPYVLHEQNARPGAANRRLAARATLIFVGSEAAAGRFPSERTRVVGSPIRAEMLAPMDREQARRALGVPTAGGLCLCFGGSQGAAGMNRLLLEALRREEGRQALEVGPRGESPWHLLWVTGPAHRDAVRSAVEAETGLRERLTLIGYLDRMELGYAAADLVVARAGALTIAELTALGKPSVIIPLPSAAGGHQRDNARALETAGGAIVIDETAPEAAARLAMSLRDLMGSCDKRSRLAEASRRLGRPGAADAMAEAILAQMDFNRGQ